MINKKFTAIKKYISTLPEKFKKYLQIMRETIKNAAPGASETISMQAL